MQRLLSITDVSVIVHLTKQQIYNLMDTGKFPRPIRVGVRRVLWLESELNDFINSRIAERDKKTNPLKSLSHNKGAEND